MSRAALVVFALVAALAIFLLVADPLGFFADPVQNRADGETVEIDPLTGGPVLAGKPGAIDPATGDPRWIGGERVGVVDLGLGSAALHGTVTGDGTPLFGARVRLVLQVSPDANHAVRTRRDGTWEIRGVPPGSPDLRATHLEHIGRSLTVPEFGEKAEVEVETIDLERRKPHTDGLMVKVLDEFGRPVVGAKILVTTMPWAIRVAVPPEIVGQPGVIEHRGLTNERGEAAFTGLAPEAYDVVAMAEGYRMAARPSLVLSGGITRHIQFRLIPGVSISGTVTGPDGNPVSGAYVTGLQLPTFVMGGAVTADGAGRFVLDGLREGQYWVMGFHDDHGQGQANPVRSPSSGLQLKLAGAGVLQVSVKRPDGKPVTRYQVRPFQPGPFRYEYSQVYKCTSEDGLLEMKLPPSTYNLLVQGAAGNLSSKAQAVVTIGETTKVDVVLPVSINVHGVVVDPDGNHLSNAEVYVNMGGMPGGPKREQYARTDTEGAFKVTGLPAETVKLHAAKSGFATTVLELDLSSGESPGEQTVTLGRGGVIEGRITIGGEEAAAGVQVNVYQTWFHPITTTSGGDGSYRVEGLTPGTWSVSTGKFEFGSSGASQSGITVGEGTSQTVNLDLGVPQGTRSVTGIVTQGGEGIVGATISVIDDRGWEHVITTTSDSQGAFQVDGVQAGRVTVQVATPEGIRKSTRVDVPAEGDVPEVAVVLEGGSLNGRLTLEDGSPVSAAWIQVELVGAEGWGRVKAQISSDTEGVFRASGLAPGRYQVRVTGSEYAGFLSDPFVVPESGSVDIGTFRLSRGISLQGRIVDDQGAPIENATIALNDAQGRPVYLFSLVTTGSDGRYAVTGLKTGRYVVGFEAIGYAPASQDLDLGPEGATVDGVLTRGGAVVANVKNEEGRPVPGVRIGIVDASGRTVERTLSLVSIFAGEVGRSGETGLAVVPDLAPGTYTVVVQSGAEIVGDPPSVRVAAGEIANTTLIVR